MGASNFGSSYLEALHWVSSIDAFIFRKAPNTSNRSLIQFFQDIILYGFSTFLPSILSNGLGYSKLEAQYFGVPVYFLGGVTFFVAAKIGDKYHYRGTVLLLFNILAVIGYAILLTVKNPSIQYFACFLIAFRKIKSLRYSIINADPNLQLCTTDQVSMRPGSSIILHLIIVVPPSWVSH